MKAKIIGMMLSKLILSLPPDIAKQAIDAVLDIIEKKIEDSANKIDDAIILAVCKSIRIVFDIPDND